MGTRLFRFRLHSVDAAHFAFPPQPPHTTPQLRTAPHFASTHSTKMNPKCGVCNKTVYPVEKISPGNGKNYHKLCFKCSVCKITLNLKNFKSHEGTLYCPVHYAPAQVEVRSFESERKADQGEYASNPSSTQAAAGGAWGQSTPDSGEYGGGGAAAAGGYDQGGYDQGGYEQQGGYDQGGYQQEYYE